MEFDVGLLRRALARPRASGRHALASGVRPAAVAVPVVVDPDPAVLFVERAAHLREHAGEVGFPGGKPESSDQDLLATALRETEEEVGLSQALLQPLGTLSPCPVRHMRYLIHPFVVVVSADAIPVAASEEVARVLRLPLEPLLDGSRRVRATPVRWGGEPGLARHLDLDGALLWGATAAIFFELLDVLAEELELRLPAPELVLEPPWERARRSSSLDARSPE
jgi:8-oxo-dGTP pyrophosphatase MutT (NUDIX family)